MKTQYYTASSLDGFIATDDHVKIALHTNFSIFKRFLTNR